MNQAHKVLVVEDDDDVRISIVELLTMFEYHVESAENGKVGLEKAHDFIPDIIVSDVMMPVMDGLEMAETVGKDPELAHIPIIMLTAKVKEEDKLEGLESGAIDYITKPFNSKELVLKIGNILKSREDFSKSKWQTLLAGTFEAPELTEDEQFLKDFYEAVASKIEHIDFGVSQLADMLNVSERNLYRRVKELTKVPVAECIREIRMQRALELISTRQVKTISEVAYKVGFRSPKYFSKTYKQRFGLTEIDFNR